ncbi:hypothetical protein BH23GEM5_BH23GEM5_13450 [soil metagenome]
MRRTTLAVALLLATAPLAQATEITPDVKPQLRAVEVAAPSIRTDVVVARARAEAPNTRAATVQQMSLGTILIIALVVIGVLALATAL